MNYGEFKADSIRVRRLERRSAHMTLAFAVLSAAGLYAAVAQHRFVTGFGLLLAANGMFVWGLALHRRARDLVKKWEKELI